MKITKDLTPVNFTKYSNRKIEWIVIHYFGSLGSAASVCNYFKNPAARASAHYAVDDSGVWQSVEDKNAAWHCGDSGTGAYKQKCKNANSIGIEVRPYIVDTSKAADASYRGWYFHEQTVDNLTELVRDLMTKYNIPTDHVIRHYDVTAKWCPRPWMGNDWNIYYKATGNEMWNAWKEKLEDEDMTDEKFAEYMERYLAKIAAKEPGGWSANERAWAEEQGIIRGDASGMHYKSGVTREEMVVMLNRALK